MLLVSIGLFFNYYYLNIFQLSDFDFSKYIFIIPYTEPLKKQACDLLKCKGKLKMFINGKIIYTVVTVTEIVISYIYFYFYGKNFG